MLSSPLLVPTIFPVDVDPSIVVDVEPVFGSFDDIHDAGVVPHPVPFEYVVPSSISVGEQEGIGFA
jgi:hypothetical protein